jgi:hypothetical protein
VIEPEAETLAVELSVPVVLEEAVALTEAVPVEEDVCKATRTGGVAARWSAWGPESNGSAGSAPKCKMLPKK